MKKLPVIRPITSTNGIQTFRGERLSKGDGKGGRHVTPIERQSIIVGPDHTLALVEGHVQIVLKNKGKKS